MKAWSLFWGLNMLLSLVMVSSALSQPAIFGTVRVEDYEKLFNPQTMVTLKGEVASLDTLSAGRGHQIRADLIFLNLKTDQETVLVYLGPKPFLDKQMLKIAAKDQVVVQGSRVSHEGRPLVIATAVRKGDQGLRLRNPQGQPLWGKKP